MEGLALGRRAPTCASEVDDSLDPTSGESTVGHAKEGTPYMHKKGHRKGGSWAGMGGFVSRKGSKKGLGGGVPTRKESRKGLGRV